MAIILKACPFCGGTPKAHSQRVCEDAEEAWVECTSCEARTLRFEDAYAPHDQAADYWNRRDGGGWQPIETAPKGVDIIGLFPNGAVRGMWFFAPSSQTLGWCAVGLKDFKANPTHWMPRPAAPQ